MKNIGTWFKKHLIAVIAVLVVIALAFVLVFAFTGKEKKAIKKYISAQNSFNPEKIENAIDIKAAIAWDQGYYITEDNKEISGVEFIKNFDKAVDSITDEDVEQYRQDLQDAYSGDTSSFEKYKLVKVIYSTEAVDNKDIKKVVCKVRVTTPPTEDAVVEVDEEVINTDDEETDEDVIYDDEIDEETEDVTDEDLQSNEVVEETEEDDDEIINTDDYEEIEAYSGEEYETEDNMWKNNKKYKSEVEQYVVFYLYQNKVIGMYLEY